MDALKLPLKFDTSWLVKELEQIERGVAWHNHPDYTVAKSGDWTAVALIAPKGANVGDAQSLRYRGGVGEPTEILQSCPYLRGVIASFHTEVHRARLMNLRPGADIAPHRDYGAQRYSIERGFIRVHIPIRSHERVSFFINGSRIPMQPGEAWYTDVCQPHAVRNESDVQRVHLVLDMRVNDWVLGMFPAMSFATVVRGAILRRFERPFIAARFAAMTRYQEAKRMLGDLGLRRLRDALRS